MATLVQKGQLAPGTLWVQEGIVGSAFSGYVEQRGTDLIPHITGSAYVTAHGQLELDESDPFRYGF
jgi:proline racemase